MHTPIRWLTVVLALLSSACSENDGLPAIVGTLAWDRIELVAEIGEPITEDRKSTRLNSSHSQQSRMPSSA